MVPSALAIPTPIPLVLDLTLALGPVLLFMLLALLGLSALGVLRAARRSRQHRPDRGPARQPTVTPLRRHWGDPAQASTPPSHAA